MDKWRWALRVTSFSWTSAIRLSGDAVVRASLVPLRLTLWLLLYCFGFYEFIYVTIQSGIIGCHSEIFYEIFKVYNVMFVMAVYLLLGLLTNLFCCIRLHLRDITTLIRKSNYLFSKAYKDLSVMQPEMRTSNKFIICIFFILPFVESVYFAYDCLRSDISRGTIHWSFFLQVLVFYFVFYSLKFPVLATMTLFYMTLDTINDCFIALCTHIESISSSNNPKPFLVLPARDETSHPSLLKLTAERTSLLRAFHDDLVLYVDSVMTFFQGDILVFFLMSFYQTTVYSYSIVGSGFNFSYDNRNLTFLCISLLMLFHLTIGIWTACICPSRIQEQQKRLLCSVARLSAVSHLPSDAKYEVRMFQLQVRNHKARFEVYGMFQVNISLLFTMGASILSYIVVLIQFTIESETSSRTFHSSTNHTTSLDNTSYANSSV